MPKRLKEGAAETTVSQLAVKIRESANQIWLAGLGAFSKAREEGVKSSMIYFEDLMIGHTAEIDRLVTDYEVVAFSRISGDTNPVHLSDKAAAQTPFKRRIAHGAYVASLISAALGTQLPGPGTIYLSQTLTFRAPVYLGDIVRARVTVETLAIHKPIATLKTQCFVGDKLVIDGKAEVMLKRRPVELAEAA